MTGTSPAAYFTRGGAEGKGAGNRHLASGLLYRAVRFWMAAYQTGAVAPKPRSCATAEDDRIVLTREGAAFLTDAAAPLPAQTLRYEDLYPVCRVAGCNGDALRTGGLCDDRAAGQPRRIDQEAKRGMVAV